MRVRCCFQFADSCPPETNVVLSNNDTSIRLYTSVNIDGNSALVVLICTNQFNNNHIVAYYTEQRSTTTATTALTTTTTTKPKVIVRQIYYHAYNEDIVAVCLSDDGERLVLINASSIIYVIPIKNLLLKDRKPLSSQKRSMCHYDATIVDCCSLQSPSAITYWNNVKHNNNNRLKDIIIVGNSHGEISFVDWHTKQEIASTYVTEEIKSLEIIMDCFNYTLLITCKAKNDKQQQLSQYKMVLCQLLHSLEPDNLSHLNTKPHLIKLDHNNSASAVPGQVTTNYQQPPTTPLSAMMKGGQPMGPITNNSNNNNSNNNQSAINLIMYQGHREKNNIGIIDVATIGNSGKQQRQQRFARFYHNRVFNYRINSNCSLTLAMESLERNEMILQLLLTDRFVAIITDYNRCLIYSRNSCDIRWMDNNKQRDNREGDFMKEITFSADEQILVILRSPLCRDTDKIIDSFFLVTRRAIYSIEARHNFRAIFFATIDKCVLASNALTLDALGASDALGTSDTEIKSRSGSEETRLDKEAYERVEEQCCAYSFMFRLEIGSLYEAYADRLLKRGLFAMGNKFFEMANFSHCRIVGKYIRLSAYKEAIAYVIGVLDNTDSNKSDTTTIEQNERILLSKIAFECLLSLMLAAKSRTLAGNGNSSINNEAHTELIRLINKNLSTTRDDAMSQSTIAATTTTNITKHSLKNSSGQDCEQLEKLLIKFILQYIQPSTYSYVMQQLVDFDLVEMADILCSKRNIHYLQTLIRILLNRKGKTRLAFNTNNMHLVDKLMSLSYEDLVVLNERSPVLLKVLTSSKVTNAFVNNINLINEYLKYSLKIVLDADVLAVKKLARIFDPRRSITQILLNRVLTRNNDSQSATYWMQDTVSTPQVCRQDVLNFFLFVLLIILRNEAPIYDHSYVCSSSTSITGVKDQTNKDKDHTNKEDGDEKKMNELKGHKRELVYDLSLFQSILKNFPSDFNLSVVLDRCLKLACPQAAAICLEQMEQYTEAAKYQLEALARSIVQSTTTSAQNNEQHELQQSNLNTEAVAIDFKESKHLVENIFHKYMQLALCVPDEATKLWLLYTEFWLENIGSSSELEQQIIANYNRKFMNDYRFVLNLYKAIQWSCQEEHKVSMVTTKHDNGNDKNDKNNDHNDGKTKITPKKQSLNKLFSNRFLLQLLSVTLDDVSSLTNIDSIANCPEMDLSCGNVLLPVEHVWRRIFKSIQTTAQLPNTVQSRE